MPIRARGDRQFLAEKRQILYDAGRNLPQGRDLPKSGKIVQSKRQNYAGSKSKSGRNGAVKMAGKAANLPKYLGVRVIEEEERDDVERCHELVEEIAERLAVEIRLLRTSRKLTQADFGAHLGVSERTVREWESSAEGIDVGMLIRIAVTFDMGLSVLFPQWDGFFRWMSAPVTTPLTHIDWQMAKRAITVVDANKSTVVQGNNFIMMQENNSTTVQVDRSREIPADLPITMEDVDGIQADLRRKDQDARIFYESGIIKHRHGISDENLAHVFTRAEMEEGMREVAARVKEVETREHIEALERKWNGLWNPLSNAQKAAFRRSIEGERAPEGRLTRAELVQKLPKGSRMAAMIGMLELELGLKKVEEVRVRQHVQDMKEIVGLSDGDDEWMLRGIGVVRDIEVEKAQ